ncbi:DUF4268 domain-containing protein [Jidongwangia harbinensis]|uniref:DUF4268 domain-containing protein n=1 Tax=Jidongwangia harbinensis TaxID=2878561 RepID=UPI001CD96C08|nr:DUF4268 domain-containing protein [Jidongwangia harbinensis]MCA2218424.1 DUF4268 domain-containing protein [Jidongwangia harbinensis]
MSEAEDFDGDPPAVGPLDARSPLVRLTSLEPVAVTAVWPTQDLYRQFWSEFEAQAKARGRTNASAPATNWWSMPTGVTGTTWEVSYAMAGCRSQLNFGHPDPNVNSARWQVLRQRRAELEKEFGDELVFDDLPNNKSCRIEVRLSDRKSPNESGGQRSCPGCSTPSSGCALPCPPLAAYQPLPHHQRPTTRIPAPCESCFAPPAARLRHSPPCQQNFPGHQPGLSQSRQIRARVPVLLKAALMHLLSGNVAVMYEPKPRLFAAGNPRDRQTGGHGGAVAAVVLLIVLGGAAALYSLFVLPYSSGNCGDSDSQLICSAAGQQVVAVGPLLAVAVGSAISICSLSLRPGRRAFGIALGYGIGFGGFLVANIVARQV